MNQINPRPSRQSRVSRSAFLQECAAVVPHVPACACLRAALQAGPHADRRTTEVLAYQHRVMCPLTR